VSKESEQVTYFVPGESGRIAALRRTPGEDDYSILYLHSTHNGSASVVTDEAGLVVERQDFDPFGRKRPLEWTPGSPMTGDQADVDIGFTGHRKVEDYGLIDMGGRHYDPHLGRFASPDPVLAAPGSSQGYDPFAYVFNDPLSFTDPSGFVPSASQVIEAMEDDPIGAGTAETTIISISPHVVALSPILSYEQIFGGVDAEAETEVGGEGAAGEPGAAAPWDGRGGLAPIALERTQTELPRLPTPSFKVRPPVGGSAMDYLSYGVENYGAATWGFMAQGTNAGIALVESVVNINYHAERAGVFAGRALVRTGQAMDNGNLWSWHTLMNIADDAAIASGEVGQVIDGVVTGAGGAGFAAGVGKGLAAKGGGKVRGPDTMKPGPFARESIPARSKSQRFNKAERDKINEIGDKHGCHTCGAPTSGRKSGNWTPDHQPVSKMVPDGTPQVLLPHCKTCSATQGGHVSHL